MEERLREKALNDHFIDVLKVKVEEYQEKNHVLNGIIEKQNETIGGLENKFVEKIRLINSHYSEN